MTKTDSPNGNGPNRSIAKSCHGPLGNGVDLIGSGFAGTAYKLTAMTGFAKLLGFFVDARPPYL